MNSFHPFPRLPAELRAQIWHMTVEPRTVEVRAMSEQLYAAPYDPYTHIGCATYLTSNTPVPSTLQTCREARNLKLYQQVFSEVQRLQSKKQSQSQSPVELEHRYVWANLEIDIISIGTTRIELFEPVASSILWLRLERENSCESWYHFESQKLRMFTHVKRIYIVCLDGMQNWEGNWEEHSWPCGTENVYMIDPKDGHMLKAVDMEEMYIKRLTEDWALEGYEYPSGHPLARGTDEDFIDNLSRD